MNSIDISLVLITWKMKSLLERLLKSFINYSDGFTYEIIVIDNNSQDGTIELIESEFPDIRLIKNSQNKGVAPARNQGLKIATGNFVLILDADMELTENSIEHLFRFMKENPQAGLVGCKLTEPNGELQYSCKRFPTVLSLIFRRLEGISFIDNSKSLKNHKMTDWDHNSISQVDYLIGACQFIRKEVIDQIGFYDEEIFYGPEDIDYCLRTWRAGWKVYYYPFTQIIHHEQRITKKSFFSKITFKHLLGIFYIFKKYNGKLSRA